MRSQARKLSIILLHKSDCYKNKITLHSINILMYSSTNNVARRCKNQWGTPTNRERYTREVPKRQEQLNKRENQTQYLTRFSNLPTSSGQGGERDLIDSIINLQVTIHVGYTP